MSLRDEVLAALPTLMDAFPLGPVAAQLADYLAADLPNTRAAMVALEDEGRARIVRRARALHLVPFDYPGRTCIICRAEFEPVAKATVCCSHSCARHLAWQNPDMRARHSASIRASHARPETKKKMSARSRRYWDDPENRKKASEDVRRTWDDPEVKGRRLVGMDRAWSDEERRERQRQKRLKDWQKQGFREKTIAAMRTGKRGRVKRRVIELAQTYPDMTPAEISLKVGRRLEGVLHILRDARRDGVIGVRPGDGPRLRKAAAI